MIPSPQILVVDDNKAELETIQKAMLKLGTCCYPIHVERALPKIKSPISGVRIIFFDIFYGTTTPGSTTYDLAASVLRKILSANNGPYILITWSTHSSHHDDFMERLITHEDIPRPAASAALDKEKFTAAPLTKAKIDELTKSINLIIGKLPQVKAMFLWENWAQQAASSVTRSILDLVDRDKCFSGNSGPELDKLLRSTMQASIGHEQVEKNLYYALNEGLGPILLDRLVSQDEPSKESLKILEDAVSDLDSKVRLQDNEKARLNSMHLFSFSNPNHLTVGDRGHVTSLPLKINGTNFSDRFGAEQEEVIKKFVKAKGNNRTPDWENLRELCEWKIVGINAVCDQARPKTNTRLVALSLEAPHEIEGFTFSEAPYKTPIFEREGALKRLIFNWHYVIKINCGWRGGSGHYRLREPLISHVAAAYASSVSRLGIIDFENIP